MLVRVKAAEEDGFWQRPTTADRAPSEVCSLQFRYCWMYVSSLHLRLMD